MDCTTFWLSGIDAAFLAQLAAIITGLGVLIQTIRNGQNKQAAAATIAAEQNNRYLETRGAEPVTNQRPPSNTGNAGVDKAVVDLLPTQPTPAAPQSELVDLLRDVRALVEAAKPPATPTP